MLDVWVLGDGAWDLTDMKVFRVKYEKSGRVAK
jgi:hypothetical protein